MPVLRAACGGWQVLGQGLEHSGAFGLLQIVVVLFGLRAVFLAQGISQKYKKHKHVKSLRATDGSVAISPSLMEAGS
ncbi:MAG: hypothetical protein ACRD2Y_12845 [Terriglobales bacterium]